ncbi:SIMPL domain-containing protein [Sphingomonas sp. BGYR3]|uniref:SIMPL domain-containing protein n=1 Tax=Sphingomonas sp. BGYR3 TaxID=2975483 RepID=UPI0021A863E3|nr:SIMPL domain-containing protein [Sphingomonas sp. BGYR3]MDG5487470.1 SIMPL domain-containing protein [Sphingomonas sp. BGYR3]
MKRLIGLAAALLVAPVPDASAQLVDRRAPGITVIGSGTIRTAPDLARLSIAFRQDGTSPDDASRKLATRIAAVQSVLRGLDPTTVTYTSEIALRTVRNGKCTGNTVGSDSMMAVEMALDDALAAMADGTDENSDNGPCRIVGHMASASMTAEMTAVEKAGTAAGVARREGADAVRLNEFALKDPQAASRAGLLAAIADARSKAEELARASGVRLGPVVSITNGDGRQDALFAMADADVSQAMNSPPPPVVTIPVDPQPIDTDVVVTVVYAIAAP